MTNVNKALLAQRISLEGDGGEEVPYDVDATVSEVDRLERIQETAEVVRAADTAGEIHDAAVEASDELDNLANMRDVVELVNSNECWSPESFTLLTMNLESLAKRFNIEGFNVGVTLQDVVKSGGKIRLSTESMDAIIAALNTSAVNLEERSITALVELLNALGDAVPKALTRLNELKEIAATKNDRANLQPVQIANPDVMARLMVAGKIPESMSSYVNEYCQYGDALTTRYSETAFQSIMKSAIFQNGLSDLSFAGFWDSIDERIKQIKDPRSELTTAQLVMGLPGAGALFGEAPEAPQDVLTVRERLARFVEGYAPVSLSDFSPPKSPEAGESDGAPLTAPALQASEINDCLTYLTAFASKIDVKATADNCKAAWVDASRTVHIVRDTLKSCDESLLAALAGDDALLPNYLSTLFTLSAWPVLNYLTNLVLFMNAFTDYAQASLQAEESESEGEGNTDNVETLEVEGDQTAVDGSETSTGDGIADTETEEKPTEPSEVPDTGTTPDQPQDATGDGERAVVVGVGETIEAAAAADDSSAVDVGADAGDSSAVDVSGEEAPAEGGDEAVDVSADAGETTEAQTADVSGDADVTGGEEETEEDEDKEDKT